MEDIKFGNKIPALIWNAYGYAEEMLVWRNQTANNCTLLHAVAYYQNGLSLIDTLLHYQSFSNKSLILRSLLKAQDLDGNTFIHLAAIKNNIDLLHKIFNKGGTQV